MNPLPLVEALRVECWNRIGVWGDRSCPELPDVGHCHNCPTFSAAGRQFLNISSPEGYLEEWTRRLAAPPEEDAADLGGVLVFRLAEEWLALPVGGLVEVAAARPVHRIPHRGGLLAGLVNIRGELHLCVHLGRLLGIEEGDIRAEEGRPVQPRMLVVQRLGERWVFAVDVVDRVYHLREGELAPTPATVARAGVHLSRGVFRREGHTVGLLDEDRLFEALRARIR